MPHLVFFLAEGPSLGALPLPQVPELRFGYLSLLPTASCFFRFPELEYNHLTLDQTEESEFLEGQDMRVCVSNFFVDGHHFMAIVRFAFLLQRKLGLTPRG